MPVDAGFQDLIEVVPVGAWPNPHPHPNPGSPALAQSGCSVNLHAGRRREGTGIPERGSNSGIPIPPCQLQWLWAATSHKQRCVCVWYNKIYMYIYFYRYQIYLFGLCPIPGTEPLKSLEFLSDKSVFCLLMGTPGTGAKSFRRGAGSQKTAKAAENGNFQSHLLGC